jgi:signal transduction histidine kinase
MNLENMTKNDLIKLCKRQSELLHSAGIKDEIIPEDNALFDDYNNLGHIVELTEKSFISVLRINTKGGVLYYNRAAHFFVELRKDGKKYLKERLFKYIKRISDGDGAEKFKYVDNSNNSYLVKVDPFIDDDFLNIYCVSLDELRLDSDVLRAMVGHEFTRYTEDIDYVGTIEIDLTTSLARKNKLYCDLNGVEYSSSVSSYDVVKETKAFHPDDVSGYIANMKDIFSGDLLGFESVYRVNIDNIYYWRKATFHIRSNPNILIGTVEDIDFEQRQDAEVAFLSSVIREASFNSDFFYWSSNFDGTLQVSDSFENITGLLPTFELPEYIKQVHPDDLDKFMDFIETDSGRRDEHQLEYRFIKDEGELLYFKVRSFNRVDERGDVIGRVGIVVNTTSHVIASDMLKVNEYLLGYAVESSGMGYWINRIDTGEVVFSDVCVELFELEGWQNYNMEENIDRIIDVIHPDDRILITEQRDSFFEKGDAERVFTVRVIRSNNEIRWVNLTICVEVDNVIGLLYRFGTVLDVTQQHLYEKTLEKERADAINSNRAKSSFLATMSHEIRTPLNAIIGFSSILKDKELSEDCYNYVNAINTSAENLLSLLNNVLDYSKIEAKKIALSPSLINLDEFIDDLQTVFSPQAKEKGIKFITNISSQGSKIMIDVVRLRQVIFNIVSNAFKFTENGFVSIDFHIIPSDNSDDCAEMLIKIADSGIGISEDDLPNIFNSFEQSANHDVGKFGGSGLGLAISKNLVELMGGEISVQSEVGIGTKFEIFISKLKITDIGTENRKPDSNKFISVKTRVVVVEKASEKLDNVYYYLTTLGYKVLRFSSVRDTLSYLKINDVSFVVAELLEGGRWNDLIMGMRNLDKHLYTPVIAVSSDLNAKMKYDLSFFREVLYKPVVFAKFAKVIDQINEKKITFFGRDFYQETLQVIRDKFLERFIERHTVFNLDYDIILSKDLLRFASETSDLEILKFAKLFSKAVEDANLDLINELSAKVLDV